MMRTPPVNWRMRDAARAPHQLAQEEDRRRHDDDADQRHDRVLIDHHGGESDQREQIAARRRDQQVQHLAGGDRAGVETGDEFRRMPVGEEGQGSPQQLGEHPPLIVGDDAVADLRQDDRLAVGGEPLER